MGEQVSTSLAQPHARHAGTGASQTMRTNHRNTLIYFQWKINEQSVSSKRSEKNTYTAEETRALEDALQADSLLQRAECHLVETEGKQHDACYT